MLLITNISPRMGFWVRACALFEGLGGFGPWLFSFCKTKKTNENSYFAKQRERERERERERDLLKLSPVGVEAKLITRVLLLHPAASHVLNFASFFFFGFSFTFLSLGTNSTHTQKQCNS